MERPSAWPADVLTPVALGVDVFVGFGFDLALFLGRLLEVVCFVGVFYVLADFLVLAGLLASPALVLTAPRCPLRSVDAGRVLLVPPCSPPRARNSSCSMLSRVFVVVAYLWANRPSCCSRVWRSSWSSHLLHKETCYLEFGLCLVRVENLACML